MHELTLVNAIMRIVQQKIPSSQRIKQVCVEIGRLTHIDHESLRFNFKVATHGTFLESTELKIVSLSGDECQVKSVEIFLEPV